MLNIEMTFPNRQIISHHKNHLNTKTFINHKKTFLEKLDKSKKGEIDEKIIPLLNLINQKKDYFTTSSCSGRVYLWKGTGKKNEIQWLRVSHDLITPDFLKITKTAPIPNLNPSGLIWLRVEPLILHIACKDLESANKFLAVLRRVYKKSCLLSVSSKIIVEIRGSEFLEMPLYQDGELLFNNKIDLSQLVNHKLAIIFKSLEKLSLLLKEF